MKRKMTFPDDGFCRNCGTVLNDRYCSHYGQDCFTGLQRSFRQIVWDACINIFAFDDKSWDTVKKLLFRPGFLSKEYITGRLIRYTMLFKMFWLMALIFTIVFSFHDTTPVFLTKADATEGRQAPTEAVQDENNVAEKTVLTEMSKEVVSTEEKTQKGVVSDFLQYFPYFMLLVIPIFTALLALFFRKEKYAFSEHLIFAVHLHTFIFFIFALEILVAAYLFDSNWISPFFFLITCIYSMFAFYNTRKKKSVFFRMFLIGLPYFIVFFVLFLFVTMILSLLFGIRTIAVGQ